MVELFEASFFSVKVKVAQSCLTLYDPMDCTVCGILQAGILDLAAIPFSRGIFPTQGSNPGLLHWGRRFNLYATEWAIPSNRLYLERIISSFPDGSDGK